MKHRILILIIFSTVVACVNDSNRIFDANTLLTSIDWAVPSDNNSRQLKGIWSFKNDGTYIENFDKKENEEKVVMKGTWKWLSDYEISIQYKFMSIEGTNYDLQTDERDSFVLRITKLTKKELGVIRRHNGDSEDSGFAKQIIYKASEL